MQFSVSYKHYNLNDFLCEVFQIFIQIISKSVVTQSAQMMGDGQQIFTTCLSTTQSKVTTEGEKIISDIKACGSPEPATQSDFEVETATEYIRDDVEITTMEFENEIYDIEVY